LNNSAAREFSVPGGGVPTSRCSCVLARAISSDIDVARKDGCAITTIGVEATRPMGVKSLSVSYPVGVEAWID
jgi:hypothetical protein